jgi:hypothetical protein
MTTDPSQSRKGAAEWGSINAQSRLAIPAEVTDCLSWFKPQKSRIEVLIDLSKPGLITIRSLDEVAQALADQRETLLPDSESAEAGMRRTAMTHYFFRPGTLIVSARRIGLKAAILDHLETKPGGRLFCLGFADWIEAYNEQTAIEVIAKHAGDIVL